LSGRWPVHGIDGPFIAGAWLMPNITRGNLPTAVVAANVASRLPGVSPATLAGESSPVPPN
jgi:choline dehydrogenase-like flavoprotein